MKAVAIVKPPPNPLAPVDWHEHRRRDPAGTVVHGHPGGFLAYCPACARPFCARSFCYATDPHHSRCDDCGGKGEA